MSLHGLTPWEPEAPESAHVTCILFAGYDDETSREDLVYVAVNSHWHPAEMILPDLPQEYVWKIAVNTGDPMHQTFNEDKMPIAEKRLLLGERSVIVLTGENLNLPN